MSKSEHTPVLNLDPDFRRDPDTTKPYCCRCQKALNNAAGTPVTVNWDSWTVVEGHNQNEAVWSIKGNSAISNELIGADCLKAIKRATKARGETSKTEAA